MTQLELATILKPLFDFVYYEVLMVNIDGKTKPRYWNGNGYENVQIDHTKISMAYIRETADSDFIPYKIGGCAPEYKQRHHLRIVVYVREKGCRTNKKYYYNEVFNALKAQDIEIIRVITDSNRLAKMEMNGERLVQGGEAYFAFDVNLIECNNACCEIENLKCEPNQKYCLC